MPSKPPPLVKAAPRKAWASSRPTETPRLRGRAGVAQRLRRLRAEPLCRLCKEKGIVRASTVPDHIRPLSQGGSDDDANVRCLCQPCHGRVTAAQFNRTYRVPVGHDGWPEENATISTP